VTLLLAHAGHWLVSLAYFFPVLAFAAFLVVQRIRDRGARGEGIEPSGAPAGGPTEPGTDETSAIGGRGT
jgi:hypothetical protein